jgi:catechol 2,3-dioxygenase-like lactoylglutathione lyase family enzyme
MLLEAPMSRVQLALNVSDLDRAVEFYSRLFGTEPAKQRPGYANFAVADPPLKLVLIEHPAGGSLNHLGIEVETPDEVRMAGARLSEQGLAPEMEDQTTCCFAVQDKAWVHDPHATPWEVYTVLADAPDPAPGESALEGDGTCCTPATPAGRAGCDCC